MSFRTFVPAEFFHGIWRMSYKDQLQMLYVYVVSGDELTWWVRKGDELIYQNNEELQKYEKFTKWHGESTHLHFRRIRPMMQECRWDEAHALTLQSIKNFFIEPENTLFGYGYTDESAWDELIKRKSTRNILVEVIARLTMDWSDVGHVKRTLTAFDQKAGEHTDYGMKYLINEKMKKIAENRLHNFDLAVKNGIFDGKNVDGIKEKLNDRIKSCIALKNVLKKSLKPQDDQRVLNDSQEEQARVGHEMQRQRFRIVFAE